VVRDNRCERTTQTIEKEKSSHSKTIIGEKTIALIGESGIKVLPILLLDPCNSGYLECRIDDNVTHPFDICLWVKWKLQIL
jgi:hypothetical protein